MLNKVKFIINPDLVPSPEDDLEYFWCIDNGRSTLLSLDTNGVEHKTSCPYHIVKEKFDKGIWIKI